MSRNTSKIDFSCTDESINRILQRIPAARPDLPRRHSCRYNQNEDQFILLDDFLEVPSLPVHHSMDNPAPPEGYIPVIASLSEFLGAHAPDLVAGTRWFFDPLAIHTPTFCRIDRFDGQDYLYHLMIDLTCRPLESEITARGTNNRTHEYRTKRLYFECDYFPLESADPAGGNATLLQTIPVTWKGEAGQGYMIHGIWMDSDINKFFSKLILPVGKRNHPYYPVTCKQHCVSMNAFGQDGPGELHRIREVIEPALYEILADLQNAPFSETLPLFARLKRTVPSVSGTRWEDLSVRMILNEYEQKEYIIEF